MKRLLLFLFALLIITSPVQGEFFKDVVVTSSTGIWTDSRAYSTLGDAIAVIGANEQDLYIAREEVVTALTIPANIRLHFLRSGSIANSGTLAINTKAIYGDHQIFTGVGAVNFASSTEVRSRWFVNFETAITQTSNDTVTLTIDASDTLLNSAAVGDNVILKWNSPNLITIATGQTLSNIGDISAPNIRLFVVSGSIAFRTTSPLSEIRADWFGTTVTTLGIASNAAAAAGRLLLITPGTWTIDDSLTLTANIKVTQGAVLQVATTKTLTFTGDLTAGNYQIFTWTGSGAIKIGTEAYRSHVPEVNVLWFGAIDNSNDPDPATGPDSSTAFQKAFDAAPLVATNVEPGKDGLKVIVPAGIYTIQDVNPCANAEYTNSALIGYGPKTMVRIVRKSTATYGALKLTTAIGGDGFAVRNIYWQSASDGNKSAIYVDSWPTLNVRDCWFGGGNGIYCNGLQDLDVERSTFEFCVNGITGTEVFDLKISGCNFADCPRGIYLDGCYSALIENNIFMLGTSVAYSLTSLIEIAQSINTCKDININNNLFQTRSTTRAITDGIKLSGTGTRCNINNNNFIGNFGRCVNSGASWDRVKVTENQIFYTDTPIMATDVVIKLAGTYCNADNNKIDCQLVNSASTSIISISLGGAYSTANGNKVYLSYNNASALATTYGLVYLQGDYSQAMGNSIVIDKLGAGALTVLRGIYTGSSIDNCRVVNNNYVSLNSASFTNRYYFTTSAAGLCNYSSMSENSAVSADNGDIAALIVYPNSSAMIQRFATTLTAHCNVTLSTTSAFHGTKFRFVRTGAGAFNINVGTGPLKQLTAANQWCEVEFDPVTATYVLTAYGTL